MIEWSTLFYPFLWLFSRAQARHLIKHYYKNLKSWRFIPCRFYKASLLSLQCCIPWRLLEASLFSIIFLILWRVSVILVDNGAYWERPNFIFQFWCFIGVSLIYGYIYILLKNICHSHDAHITFSPPFVENSRNPNKCGASKTLRHKSLFVENSNLYSVLKTLSLYFSSKTLSLHSPWKTLGKLPYTHLDPRFFFTCWQ